MVYHCEKTDKYVTNSAIHVYTICTPLFEKLNIDYFSYGRFYDDNTFQVLVSNPKWYEHFFQQNHKLARPNAENFLKKGTAFYLWNDSLQASLVKDAKQYFNLDNGMTIIRRVPRYFEYFGFAFAINTNNNISFYINNLPALEAFGDYFIDTASKLITEGRDKKIILPTNEITHINIPKIAIESNDLLPTKIQKKRLELSLNCFSLREIDCLHLIRKGLTSKQIGDQLCLSPRTVDDYITAIKEKLGCKKKSEIILTLEKTDFG